MQAQGGGTEKSVSWAQEIPPAVSDVFRMLDELEALLTASEKRAREEAFRQARRFVQNVPRPGLAAGTKKSFPRNNRGSIRVDLEVPVLKLRWRFGVRRFDAAFFCFSFGVRRFDAAFFCFFLWSAAF